MRWQEARGIVAVAASAARARDRSRPSCIAPSSTPQRQHFDPPAARPTKGWPGSVSALITPERAWYALRFRLMWLHTNHGGECQWLRR